MPYNNIISRANKAALIPLPIIGEIIKGVVTSSFVMKLARRLPDMPTGAVRMPVTSLLPIAYFVAGDTGLKETTEVNWRAVWLNAEEIACIVPISSAVLDDQNYNIWDECKPLIVEAIGATFDGAVLFGTAAPAAWPLDVAAAATAAGNNFAFPTGPDLYDDVLGPGGMFSLVEADGYMINGSVAEVPFKSQLRGLRAATGELIFSPSVQQAGAYVLDTSPIEFVDNGSWVGATGHLISGDWRQLVYSLRQDITWKLLDQAVIQDAAGNIVYNLAQQDMVAIRVIMRIAWNVPNPVNRLQPGLAARYPFGLLT